MTHPAATLVLPEPHRSLVLAILHAHLPPDTVLTVFGSRAAGRARAYSDLDLAITAPTALTPDQHAVLAEAFCDSDLPWKVDLLDTHTASPVFRQAIGRSEFR